METIVDFVEWYGAPMVMFAVSAIYFFTDRRRPAYGARAISSAHGVIGAILYFGAMSLHWTRPLEYRPYLAIPYAILYVLPLLAIVIALFTYRGPRLVHLTQLLNLPALAWALFVGSMAATGDWL